MIFTKLLYLDDMQLFDSQAKIIDITDIENKKIIILDQTIFYPQGGGQAFDNGIIENSNGKFIVQEVRFVDGIVKHIGTFESGNFEIGSIVNCFVDKNRRILNSRIHTAGHLIDMAVISLNLNWSPSKAYHFEQGPYVEYVGSIDNLDKDKLLHDLEIVANDLIKKNISGEFFFCSKDDLGKYCKNVPEYLPKDKPIRVVKFADLAIPCGGTHVQNFADLKQIFIRKIKTDKNNIRVAYDILRN